MLAEFGIYLVVGLCSAVGHYGVLILLTELFGVDPVYASAVGFLVAGTISYVLNYRFTFRSTRKHVEALPIFCFVVAVAFVLNGGAMILFTRIMAIHYLVSQLISTGIVLIWQYSANRMWTFRSKDIRPASDTM